MFRDEKQHLIFKSTVLFLPSQTSLNYYQSNSIVYPYQLFLSYILVLLVGYEREIYISI